MILSVVAWLVILLVLLLIISFLVTLFTGGWFAPTPQKVVKEMIEVAKVKRGEVVVDLGSGDGRILIAAAKKGAKAVGFEINPYLYLISLGSVRHSGFSNNIQIHWASFWEQQLPEATVVFIYLPFQLKRLSKLVRQFKKGTRIITFRSILQLKAAKISSSGVVLYKL